MSDDVDYSTLDTLWERYDERPGRISAIRVQPDNLVTVARSLVARGIRATVDFKELSISFNFDDTNLTAMAYYDYIVTTGEGLDVISREAFRKSWRKFMDESDW